MEKLFRTKSHTQILLDAENGEYHLSRALSAFDLILLGIGCVIGAGIFVLTGTAAANYAGPAIVISFIISGLACAFAGLCYAEFASMIPMAGSAYTYAYVSIGELFAWIIGWDLVLEYLLGASTVAVGWSAYVTSFLKDLGVVLPAQLCNAPFDYSPASGLVATGAFVNLPAVLVVAGIAALLMLGIKQSARFNALIVLVKVSVIMLFIAFGSHFVNAANWHPFVPANTGEFGHFGLSGILRGAAVVFFAYIGFDAVSTAAQEAKNPQRDMPIGILVSLTICAILYIAVALVMTGILPYTKLGVASPIAAAIDAAGPTLFWLRPLVKFGAIMGLSSVILVLILGQSRILFSMSSDWLLPKVFAKTGKKSRSHYVATLVTGFVALLMAGIFPIGFLGEMVSIGSLLAFTMVCASVLVLRKTKPEIKRLFRTPWVPLVPILGIVFSVGQMLALPRDTWIRLVVWMAIGIVIYFAYGRHSSRVHHSTLQNENKS